MMIDTDCSVCPFAAKCPKQDTPERIPWSQGGLGLCPKVEIGWAGTTKDSIQIKFSKECPDFNGPFALLFKNDFVQKAEPGDIKELKAFFRTKKATTHDPVHHPSHYSWRGGMEAADIAAELCKGAEGDEAAWIFNLAKYVYRYPKKNGVQDIDKAIECLQRLKKVAQKKASHGNALE